MNEREGCFLKKWDDKLFHLVWGISHWTGDSSGATKFLLFLFSLKRQTTIENVFYV
jgi:hypothetical protein